MAAISAMQLRQLILQASKRANVGHIGSALSIADIIAVLFDSVLQGVGSGNPDRDRFILSKGHAALALYAALYEKGILTTAQFESYCENGSLLGTHPEHTLSGIDFSTGSLGQGLSMGVGAALAARLDGSSRRVFVLVSDAECNEGALWEAAMFAGHHRLSGLTAIVDNNGQQATGMTRDILSQEMARERWQAFGWQAHEVDGHDIQALENAFQIELHDQPRVLIAHTRAGHGVSFMERQVQWHYMPMSDAQYQQAILEVENAR